MRMRWEWNDKLAIKSPTTLASYLGKVGWGEMTFDEVGHIIFSYFATEWARYFKILNNI